MALIAVRTAGRIEVVESIIQATLPAAETIVAGAPVRIDTDGKFTNSNATTYTEAGAYGIALRSVAAGEALTALRVGVVDGYTLSGAYSSSVYISDTDGRLADATGTIDAAIGYVLPGWSQTVGTAADKLLAVNFAAVGGGGMVSSSTLDTFSVTTDLMAASVDKWVWVAPQACILTSISEVHSVVGGSSAAVRFRKITDTSAPGASASGTVKELAASIDLTATINTVVNPTLTATAADITLAAGDKVAADFSGTLTGLVGHATLNFKAI